jgi:hypothetical protein
MNIMARVSELREQSRWCLRHGRREEAEDLERRAYRLQRVIEMRREMSRERKAS